MKVFITTMFLFIAVAVAWSVTEVEDVQAPNRLKVVTSFTIIADIAQNVAGDKVIVQSITKPGAEIHDYQPTPQDIIRAQDADLILYNGLNLERWFERFLNDVQGVPRVVVSEGVMPISIYEGPYDGKPNPHAWMSADNVLIYIENIRKALTDLDPENAEVYAENARRYGDEIRLVFGSATKRLAGVAVEQRILVSSEGAFSYLARDLGMDEIYLWPINADRQGTPQQVRKVIDVVHEKNIPVVFSESTVSDKPARAVAAETGALYGGVLYVDSLSAEGGDVPTYLDLLRVTVETIADGFEKAGES